MLSPPVISRISSPSARFVLLITLLLLCGAAVAVLPVGDWLAHILGWLDANPVGGRLAFVLVAAVAAVLLVPGTVVVMGGGYLFGVFEGTLVVAVAVTAGAVAALLVGRYLARDWVRARVAAYPRLVALDRAIQSRAFLIVFVSRLSLALPYNLVNYAYGVSAVPVGPFALGTLTGMLPAVFLFVSLGSAARSVEELVQHGPQLGSLGPLLLLLGVGIALGLVLFLNRLARRLLEAEQADAA